MDHRNGVASYGIQLESSTRGERERESLIGRRRRQQTSPHLASSSIDHHHHHHHHRNTIRFSQRRKRETSWLTINPTSVVVSTLLILDRPPFSAKPILLDSIHSRLQFQTWGWLSRVRSNPFTTSYRFDSKRLLSKLGFSLLLNFILISFILDTYWYHFFNFFSLNLLIWRNSWMNAV